MGQAGLSVIFECIGNGNIRGLKDWVDFAGRKTDTADWRRGLGELREAQRASKVDPSVVIDVGTDAHAPIRTGRYSPQGTPEKAASFDLTVHDASGVVLRSVEVTSINKPVTTTGHIAEGIGHATTKIVKRNTTPVDAPGHPSGTPLPIPGVEQEVVIQIEFFHGERDPEAKVQTPSATAPGVFPPFAPGRKSFVFDGLGGYSAQDYVPQRPAVAGPKESPAKNYDGGRNPGNILDNLFAKLNQGAYPDASLLKRIRVVGFDGRPIALFEQDASGKWSRK